MWKRLRVPILIGGLLIPALSLAQPPEPPPPGPGHRGQARERIEERIHTMKIWKMTEELQLSDEQAARFFPLLNKLDQEMEGIEQARRKTIDFLAEAVWKKEPDQKAITATLKELDQFEQQQFKLRQQFHQDAEGILKPDQMAKLVLFNIRFPEVVRDLVRGHEEGGHPKGPPPRDRLRDW